MKTGTVRITFEYDLSIEEKEQANEVTLAQLAVEALCDGKLRPVDFEVKWNEPA